MSSTHTVPVSQLQAGDWVTFVAGGDTKIAHVDKVWEEDGQIVFYVETTSGGFMTRTHDPGDEIEVLDCPPEGA